MSDTKPIYSDGAESFLYDFFHNLDHLSSDEEIDNLLTAKPDWPLIYHLSPQRHFLLSWYDFKPNCTILEIGAGCGALTGLLLSKAKKVVANELELNRAKVIKERFRYSNNLEINNQSIKDFSSKTKFDYIIVVGVLEYAGIFYNNIDTPIIKPHEEFLIKIKTLLKKDGVLLLAIENRLGTKYFAGHPEDHTGIIFDSINNYASQSKIRTFSKTQLTNLFHFSGFSKLKYYFPFPDYKLPHSIFSEEGISTEFFLPLSQIVHSPTYDYPNAKLISEPLLALTLSNEKLLAEFANSFLVEAK